MTGWILAGFFFGLACAGWSLYFEARKRIGTLEKELVVVDRRNESLLATALESKSVQYVDPIVTAERLKAIAEARERKKRIGRVIADLEAEHRLPKPEESKAG